jgi:tetratricopeptide (TPR) repeat protein
MNQPPAFVKKNERHAVLTQHGKRLRLIVGYDIVLDQPAGFPDEEVGMTMDLSFPDFSEALKTYFMGDKRAALEELTRLAAAYPDNASVFILLGNVHYSLGALDEALLNYRKAVELGPEYGHALYKLGICSFRAGLLDEARDAFSRNLGLHGQTHAMSWYWIGLIDFFLGRDDEALASFHRLKDLSPGSNFANFFMAQLLIKHNRHQEALDLLGELLEQTPNFSEALYMQAQAFRGLFKNFDAVQCLRKAIEYAPDDKRIRMELETLIDVPSI